jgi:hypothetical protein
VLSCTCVLLAFLAIGMVDHYPLCDQSARLIFFLMAGYVSASISTRSRDIVIDDITY